MQNQEFAGAFKTNTSFLSPLERRLAQSYSVKSPTTDRDSSPHHAHARLVAPDSGIQLSGGDRHSLAVAGLADDLLSISDYYDGKIGKYRNTGLLRWGLLHGSPARLFLPEFRDHWLRFHPAGEVAFAAAAHVDALWRPMT